MRTCYFCTTPFQIMSSISMAIAFQEQADLYIIDQFSTASKTGDIIRQAGIFQNVTVIHGEREIIDKYINVKNRGGLYNHFKIAKSYLYVDEIVQHFLINKYTYEKMYISSKCYIARLVMLYFIKHKTGTEIIHFDDGEGSYDNPSLYNPSKGDSIIRWLIFGKAANDTNKKRILYSPELYHTLNPDSTIKVEQMPCLWKQGKIKEVINKMFEFQEADIVKENVVLLDILKDEVLSAGEQKCYLACCNHINDVFKKENVIVKKHPRDLSNDGMFSTYQKNNMPFEVLALNSDISSKIIIAYASTAVVTPKQIFNEEPTVILLYKLIKKENANPAFLAYYEACKNLYSSKRFFIPETEEELKSIVEMLMDRTAN